MLEIDLIRKEIEQIDGIIIESLAKRQALSKQIGQIKLQHGLAIIDPEREAVLFKLHEKLADRYHLPATFIKYLV